MYKSVLAMALALVMSWSVAGALSFAPGTIFLDADTQEECEDLGGNFTEWYDEIYCTKQPTELTTEQHAKVTAAGLQILDIIGDNEAYLTFVTNKLMDYQQQFTQQGDTLRVAIATLLIEVIGQGEATIPENCSVWYDGCNTCQVTDGGLACTKMACLVQQDPYCMAYEKTIVVADATVECVGVGPMDCLQVREQGEEEWSNYYSDIVGFEYIPGYEWTLVIQETELDPEDVPMDSSSIVWELLEVISITAEIPDNCQSWYDGCNTCVAGEGELMACTEMACLGAPRMPYCQDEGSDNSAAKAYNDNLE